MTERNWRDNLTVLGPPGSIQGTLPADERTLRGLSAGCSAVLAGSGSTKSVRRLTSSLGVRVEREFLAFPSISSPAYLVESTPAALEYFCSSVLTVPPGATWWTLPADLALRTTGWPVTREVVRSFLRERVVIGRAAEAPGVAIDDSASRYHELWHHPSAADTDLIVMGASKDPNAKVTVLGIDRATARPAVAMKVPTTDVAEAAVEHEGRLLVALRRRQPASVLPTIPRVCDLVRFDGRLGLLTTGMDGVPMSSSYLRWRHTADPRRALEDLTTVSRWLAAFQEETAGSRGPVDMGEGVADRMRARFDDPDLEVDLEELGSIWERLGQETSPRTTVHGDFWHGNILLRDGRVSGVIDWEAGSTSGEPLRDLIRFAIVYATYLDRHTRSGRRVAGHRGLRADSWGAGVRYAVDGTGWFPTLFRGFITDGLARLGVEPARWRDAVLAGLADIAATTDHQAFARHHLFAFRELAAQSRAGATRGGHRRKVQISR